MSHLKTSSSKALKIEIAALMLIIMIVAVVSAIYARQSGSTDGTLYRRHKEAISALPESSYRRDRFRDVRGRLLDVGGDPVVGGNVSFIDAQHLLVWLNAAGRTLSDVIRGDVPIETSIRTDDQGKYLLDESPEGLKFVVFRGPTDAWSRHDFLVVREGAANWGIDGRATPMRSCRGRIRLPESGAVDDFEIHVVGERWWGRIDPVRPDSDGRFLVRIPIPERESVDLWAVRRHELILLGTCGTAEGQTETDLGVVDLASCRRIPDARLADLDIRLLPSEALAGPRAILPQENAESRPFPTITESQPAVPQDGVIRGFAEAAFLPVKIRGVNRAFSAEVFADASAEFIFFGLARDEYEISTVGLGGDRLFPRRAVATTSVEDEIHFSRLDKIDPKDPRSRIIHGIVRWDDGSVCAKANVYCQDTRSFRLYSQRVETDQHGYYRFSGIAASASYLLFALAPDDENGCRNFEYCSISTADESRAMPLLVYRSAIGGVAKAGDSAVLKKKLPDGNWREMWGFRVGDDGKFRLTNIAPAEYLIVRKGSTDRDESVVLWGPGKPDLLK